MGYTTKKLVTVALDPPSVVALHLRAKAKKTSFAKVMSEAVNQYLAIEQEAATDHKLKTVQPFFSMVWRSEKTAEIRKHDRNFKPGDVLILQEWSEAEGYSGCYMETPITSIVTSEEFPEGLVEGYCLLSFGPIFRGVNKISGTLEEWSDAPPE
jgi:Domain of unknown function (DUF3850)